MLDCRRPSGPSYEVAPSVGVAARSLAVAESVGRDSRVIAVVVPDDEGIVQEVVDSTVRARP